MAGMLQESAELVVGGLSSEGRVGRVAVGRVGGRGGGGAECVCLEGLLGGGTEGLGVAEVGRHRDLQGLRQGR